MAFLEQPRAIPDGQFTSTVYGYIRDSQFDDAIGVLRQQLEERPDSRAALSLLGHCYFQTGQFELASQMYDQLVRCYPDNEAYRLHLAHALHKAGLYAEASEAAARASGPGERVERDAATLQFAIAYDRGDLPACRRLLDAAPPDDPDALANTGCLLYREGEYAAAAKKFDDATHALGRLPQLLYAAAVCHYRLRAYGPALRLVAEIVDAGAREHPELGVGSASEGAAAPPGSPRAAPRSVGNSQALRDTALVEALNLKAAVEVALGNPGGAAEALADMPPSALAGMGSDPAGGFRRLNHLLGLASFPPEAFPNLLLLYASPAHRFLDLAADVMADNPALVHSLLTRELAEFLSALVARASAPDEAFARLDALAAGHVSALRSLTKRLQDARVSRDSEAIRAALERYDDALARYTPVLMAMASIPWERGSWSAVERLLRQSAEFCGDCDAWRLNMAHALFMQARGGRGTGALADAWLIEERYADAVRHYQPLVVRAADSLLALPAIVLANLCVCYVMTSQNEEAEELMRRVEAAEEEADGPGGGGQASAPRLHLAIINLGNYEFGVSRVLKSLEPLQSKLSTDTWFYAKRVLLALAEGLAKHTVALRDAAWEEVGAFLAAAEAAGARVPAAFAGGGGAGDAEGRSVGEEARALRGLLARLAERRY
ncbi:flagellar associated protein [Raphidocelis subcapitata]|uniref:Flagellar associated protein n=1 Tax=Raphidocelis subcapitata TaxID=307507 RepID=A0A2V0PBT6_9CHLO|nr:flagellar associated protein [Raphidocelis subcapitata]|eukprot:GBF97318.1 flagellar associated protein [Raphidocelis subcapitata]